MRPKQPSGVRDNAEIAEIKAWLDIDIPKQERKQLKQLAASVRLRRVDAIDEELISTFTLDELKRLRSHLNHRITHWPKKVPHRPKEDHAKEEEQAYALHAFAIERLGLTSGKADEFVGRCQFVEKKTAENRRKAYADRLAKLEKKPHK